MIGGGTGSYHRLRDIQNGGGRGADCGGHIYASDKVCLYFRLSRFKVS